MGKNSLRGIEMKALDWIFKVGLLVLGLLFIGIYYFSSQNGRYQYIQDESFRTFTAFDTKTGIAHQLNKKPEELKTLQV